MAKSGSTNLQFKLIIKKEPGLKYTKVLSGATHNRSTISMIESKDTLTIEIKAKDATALRASTNSILRDLQVIEATRLPSK